MNAVDEHGLEFCRLEGRDFLGMVGSELTMARHSVRPSDHAEGETGQGDDEGRSSW